MKKKNIKKIIAVSTLAVSTFFCTATMASARIRHIYHSSSHSGTYSSISDDPLGAILAFSLFGLAILAFVSIFIYAKIVAKKEKQKKYGNYMINPDLLPKNHNSEIVNAIHQIDSAFQENLFVNMAENDLKTLLNAAYQWEAVEVDNIAVDSAAQKLKQKIYDLQSSGLRIKMENPQIDSRYLTLYQRDRNFEYLTAYFALTYKEILMNQKNNFKPKSNGKNKQFLMLTYTRRKGFQDNDLQFHSKVFCPNCGSEIMGKNNLNCQYCGSKIIQNDFDWTLTDWTEITSKDVIVDDRGVVITDE